MKVSESERQPKENKMLRDLVPGDVYRLKEVTPSNVFIKLDKELSRVTEAVNHLYDLSLDVANNKVVNHYKSAEVVEYEAELKIYGEKE